MSDHNTPTTTTSDATSDAPPAATPPCFREVTVASAWQFQPHTNHGQPEFVQVQQALGGVRAIVRPPAATPPVQNVILHLVPGDWLIGLRNGAYLQLNGHAAAHLITGCEG